MHFTALPGCTLVHHISERVPTRLLYPVSFGHAFSRKVLAIFSNSVLADASFDSRLQQTTW